MYHTFDFSVKKVKSLYIDTTFCSPENLYIPSRQHCIDATYQLVCEWISQSPQHVVYMSLRAQYGHEPLLNAVASRLNKKVNFCNRLVVDCQHCIDATYQLVCEWISQSPQHVVYMSLREQYGHEPLLNAVASRLNKKVNFCNRLVVDCQHCIDATYQLVCEWISQSPQHVVYMSLREQYGHEPLLNAVASRLNKKVNFCNRLVVDCQHCIDATYQLVCEWISQSPQHVVYMSLREQYGHEPLLNAVASRLNKKVNFCNRLVVDCQHCIDATYQLVCEWIRVYNVVYMSLRAQYGYAPLLIAVASRLGKKV